MAKASYDYISTLIPEIKDVSITQHSDFERANGEQFFDSDFKRLAEQATEALRQRSSISGAGETARIGSATLKRAAITGTVSRGESSASGRALLASIGSELHANLGRAEFALYSKGIGASLEAAANNSSGLKQKAIYLIADHMNDSGKIGWWDKSVGTPYNLAKKSPLFANVYDCIQNFISEVSMYTAEAAALAPTILPKLDALSEMWIGSASNHSYQKVFVPSFSKYSDLTLIMTLSMVDKTLTAQHQKQMKFIIAKVTLCFASQRINHLRRCYIGD